LEAVLSEAASLEPVFFVFTDTVLELPPVVRRQPGFHHPAPGGEVHRSTANTVGVDDE
jgi:hypothetical protein